MSNNKILIFTDGYTEELTLNDLLNKAGGTYVLQVVRLSLHPEAPVSSMRKVLEGGCKKLTSKKTAAALSERYRKVILVIDYETQDCSRLTQRKAELEQCLAQVVAPVPCAVVFKFRTYENWIIADPETLDDLNGFTVSQAMKNRVSPNKADAVDASSFLSAVKSGSKYDKIRDGQKLVEKLNIEQVERNSRSFRKMLKEIEVHYHGISSKSYRPRKTH